MKLGSLDFTLSPRNSPDIECNETIFYETLQYLNGRTRRKMGRAFSGPPPTVSLTAEGACKYLM